MYSMEIHWRPRVRPLKFDHYNFINRYKWIAVYFELGPNETNSLGSIHYFEQREFDTKKLMGCRTNIKDLHEFRKGCIDRYARSNEGFVRAGGPSSMFRTHYSVGFSSVKVEHQDYIFAVDGVRTPLVLRKNNGASPGYRVVGECYLWAALELDYWNPGTRKGIWSSRPYDLGQVQTRMIEIF
jgi:hypothetical protein